MTTLLTFDEFARPLMYTALMKSCEVPIKSRRHPTAKPFWHYFHETVPKSIEPRYRARAERAAKLLLEREDWPYRAEFLKRFNTLNPMEFFQEDLTRFTVDMKAYVLRPEFLEAREFNTGRRRLRQSTPIARSNRSSMLPVERSPVHTHSCVICLSTMRRSANARWQCLKCHQHFHETCIIPWLRTQNGGACPHCRARNYLTYDAMHRYRPNSPHYSSYDDDEGPAGSHETSVYSEYTVNSGDGGGRQRALTVRAPSAPPVSPLRTMLPIALPTPIAPAPTVAWAPVPPPAVAQEQQQQEDEDDDEDDDEYDDEEEDDDEEGPSGRYRSRWIDTHDLSRFNRNWQRRFDQLQNATNQLMVSHAQLVSLLQEQNARLVPSGVN